MAQGTPNFAINPVVGSGVVVTSDGGNRAVPANPVTILAAGAGGSRIERISLTPLGTVTSTVVRLWLYNSANTTYSLYAEVQIQPSISNGSVAMRTQTIEAVTAPNLMPILLPAGWSLVASINDTQTAPGVGVVAIGGNF